MSRVRFGVMAAIVSIVALMVGPAAHAQQEIDLGAATLQSSRDLDEARRLYGQAEFSESILALDRLLAEFETRPAGTLPIEEEELRAEALRLRGLAYANLGQMEAAQADFVALLRQSPEAQLDRTLVSPKILKMFEEVRDRVTAILVVRSDPPGAEVRLGQTLLGVTPLEPVRLAAGRYLLDVERRGFAVAREGIELAGGGTTEKDYVLERSARNVSVITVPSGVEISVDGRPVGSTSGTPPPGFEMVLYEKGIDPEQASAPLTAPLLSAGRHVIRAEKECFAPVEAVFDVTLENGETPLELEPIVLPPSRAGLRLVSEPAGAMVRVDGRRVGTAPLEVDGLCGDSVEIRMDLDGVGRWEEDVALVSGSVEDVRGELRLSLASLGAVREIGVPSSDADVWDQELHRLVAAQRSYRPVQGAISPEEIGAAHLEVFRHLQVGAAGERVLLDQELRRRLADEIGADLFLVAVPESDRRALVFLYGLNQGRPDMVILEMGGEEADHLVQALDTPGLKMEAWSGLLTVETAESDFPLVVAVSSAAPSGATLRPGDRVRAVEGRPVVGRKELEVAFSGRTKGDRVPVTVSRGAALVEAFVVTAETPVLPRPGDQGLLLNKSIADLERLRRMVRDDRTRSLAALGIGLAYLMTGEPRTALETGFRRATLGAGGGISAGTVAFLEGLALDALGPEAATQAREAFARAATEKDATLWRDDGPLVAPLAEARGTAAAP